MCPVRSATGLLSQKVSSGPVSSETSFSPPFLAAATRPSERSSPSSQSNDSVCRARRLGTSRGSLIRANETRRGRVAVAEALREAANRGPSELVADGARARETPCGYAAGGCWGAEDEVGAA